MTCLFCDRPHEARGLCHNHYEVARVRGLLGGFPPHRERVPAGPKARRDYWREYKRRKAQEARNA